MSWSYLSYNLSPNSPAYGGGTGFEWVSQSKISEGKSNNSFRFQMNNHLGTHIDLPKHFIQDGRSLSNYTADFWVKRRACVIDCPMKPGQMIESQDLNRALGSLESHELKSINTLYVRTGFETYRTERIYWENNPGFLPEVAFFLKEKFPQVHVLGMDTISLTSFQNRELGREAHRAFLGNKSGEPILLVEDMKLSAAKYTFFSTMIHPLQIENADGGPCSVLGEFV